MLLFKQRDLEKQTGLNRRPRRPLLKRKPTPRPDAHFSRKNRQNHIHLRPKIIHEKCKSTHKIQKYNILEPVSEELQQKLEYFIKGEVNPHLQGKLLHSLRPYYSS